MSNPSGRRTTISNQIQTSRAHKRSVAASVAAIARPRKRGKSRIKLSSLAIYAGVFVLVVVLVALGYQAPQQTNTQTAVASTPTAQFFTQTPISDNPTADEVQAVSIAATAAMSASLPVADAVNNLAASTEIKRLYQAESSTSVPTVIELTAGSRSISTYTVKSGDTVASIAKQFGISAQTVQWANNLVGNSVTAGTVLDIPPIDGVIYITKVGDTAQSIAQRYSANASRIISYNDLEISGIKPGQKIVLPNATLPISERPGYVAPTLRYGYSGGDYTVINPYKYVSVSIYSKSSSGNRNTLGQCTWWAWERRAAMGRPLPSRVLGNAAEWATSLGNSGYTVNNTPAVGAVIQNGAGAISWYGHVGVVEKINYKSDGSIDSIVISEMNNGYAYRVTERTIPGYALGMFNFIH